MDINYQNLGASAGIVSTVIGISYAIWRIVHHSQCKSKCCCMRSEFDINLGTPEGEDKFNVVLPKTDLK